MNIAVFCGSHVGNNPQLTQAVSRLGTLLAQQGHTLIYGGSNMGYMGLVATTALRGGARVVAVIPSLFGRDVIDSQPVSELIIVDTMADRKLRMMQLADAFIALPGGIGTLDELTEVQAAMQLGINHKPALLLNVDGFFNSYLAQLQVMVDEGLYAAEELQKLIVVDSPEAVFPAIERYQ